MIVDDLATLLGGFRFHGYLEEEIQRGIAAALTESRVEYFREARISAADRPDFLVGDVAIEVKVAGAAGQVRAQLARYVAHDQVGAVLLITTRASHLELDGEIAGKVVRVVLLARGIR